MDRFKEQLDALKDAEKDITIFLKERALLVKNKESTGKVTYLFYLSPVLD
jgi:hypothetical protein